MATFDGRNSRDYSKSELYLGNLAIIAWIILGAVSFAFFYPLAALAFFAVSAYLVFYELGKHGCVTCYYCKTCTIGMGKLPEFFFRKTGTANVNLRAQELFPLVYLLLAALPIALTVISLFQQTTIYKVALLTAVFGLSLYTGITRRQTLFKSLIRKTLKKEGKR